MPAEPTEMCASRVMDTIPLVMQTIVGEMRRSRLHELSAPQFRALMFVKSHEGASLSSVSKHVGSTLSSASKLINGLVERGHVTRENREDDRRRITLRLSPSGEAVLEAVHRAATAYLGERLSSLSGQERLLIARAMELLRSIFS